MSNVPEEEYDDYEDDDLYEEESSPLRVGLIVGGIVLGVAIISLLLLWMFNDDSEDSFSSDTLENEEIGEIESTVSSFLLSAGNFGLIENEYEAEDYHDIYNVLRYESVTSLSAFSDLFKLRDESYLELREGYILEDSYVWYSDDDVESWDVSDDMIDQRNFLLDFDSIEFLEMEVISDEEESNRSVEAEVQWISEEKIRYEVSSIPRSDWDGSVQVMGKNYQETANIVLTEVGDRWLISNVYNVNNEHVLSTWGNPTDLDSSDNLEEREVLTPSTPFRILQENTDGTYEDNEGNTINREDVNSGDHLLSSGFFHYCSEDMPTEYGDPSEYGYEEERDENGNCRWILNEDMTPEQPH